MNAIALTNFGTGQFGVIDHCERIRLEKLQSLGVSFDQLMPHANKIIFTHLPGKWGTPMYLRGALITAGLDKGEVLEHWLSYIKLIYFSW